MHVYGCTCTYAVMKTYIVLYLYSEQRVKLVKLLLVLGGNI
jgi:hypothetical protein